jgi:subtilisin family serine protease
METPGGNLYIPDRAVEVFNRRPVSRNTHYLLTDEEANQIRRDPRVLEVDLSIKEQGLILSPSWIEISIYWNKSNSIADNYKNWGLLRSVEGASRPSWGSNGAVLSVTGEINVTASGKNVDVVVVDGHMNPNHPEFAVNNDGTGGSRVVQYNWFNLNPTVTGGSAGTYIYTPYVDPTYPDTNGDGYSDRTTDNDHGTHVAGIIAGNTQGWAHDANIYNISPYASSPSASTIYFIDYVKVWHQNKLPNPITGVKNPTVTNHSYGLTGKVAIASITSVRINGTIINGPFTSLQLSNYGIYNTGGYAYPSLRNTAIEQDLIDLMAAGVIVVGAAGNQFSKVSNYSATVTDDYNNYFSVGSFIYYYLRGSITAVLGAICVGCVGSTVNEAKASFSNRGPRVDLYAPGSYIMSSVNSTINAFSNDVRNTAYYISKKSGTSMASPQVAGVVACVAETWPTMKQSQISTYIQSHSTKNQITAGTGGASDYTDLQGSENRYLYFYKERQISGQVGPKINLGNRPTQGQAWPRPKIYRYGR